MWNKAQIGWIQILSISCHQVSSYHDLMPLTKENWKNLPLFFLSQLFLKRLQNKLNQNIQLYSVNLKLKCNLRKQPEINLAPSTKFAVLVQGNCSLNPNNRPRLYAGYNKYKIYNWKESLIHVHHITISYKLNTS